MTEIEHLKFKLHMLRAKLKCVEIETILVAALHPFSLPPKNIIAAAEGIREYLGEDLE